MEELGLDYELVTMPLDEKVLRQPDMLERNPFGKVPAIEDGDVTLFESGAIIEYLLETYGEGRFQPKKGSPEWLRHLQWMHGSETLANFVGVVLFTSMRIPEEVRSDIISDAAKTRARFALLPQKKISVTGPASAGLSSPPPTSCSPGRSSSPIFSSSWMRRKSRICSLTSSE